MLIDSKIYITGNEAALFMRLHLLQGVVFYHQNKREEAKRLFERASNELKALKVDDESLSTLIELGKSLIMIKNYSNLVIFQMYGKCMKQ